MTEPAARLETFLARLYSDEAARAEFVADPQGVATRAHLDEGDVARLATVDCTALALAAASFAAKRARQCRAR